MFPLHCINPIYIQLSNTLVLVPLNQMKSFFVMLPAFWSLYLHLLLLFPLNSLWGSLNSMASGIGNETDHLALLKFKESISGDPYGVLVSWNGSTHFCKWHGITCSPIHQRVTELSLQGCQLHGFINPQIGNLSFLRNLDLGNNSFHGKIPQELGRLVQLQQLSLINNSLAGEIPTNLTSCFELKRIDFSWNNLIGKIPMEIGSLWKLQVLKIHRNKLTGQIPPSIWNISSLTFLGVNDNNLEGNIPQEIGRLKNFTIIAAGTNKLSGTLPSSLYNVSSLTVIAVGDNFQLNGSLPSSMFLTLPNLKHFSIAGNQISGPIPNSIRNASNLQVLDIAWNHFIGPVPSLQKLKDLSILSLANNSLGSSSTRDLEFLINSLSNCSKLERLDISYNNFGGRLPDTLGNLSNQLSQLYIGGNLISGKIPPELGKLSNLILLTMEINCLTGIIPVTFEKFKKLQMLDLSENKLSGDIPAFIGNLSSLFFLALSKNMLQGSIPPSIGKCQMLQLLDLSHNTLRGTIPLEVFSFSLTILDLSKNSLSGNLPQEVGRLKNIDYINVSENHLSGNIPGTIGECISLEHLYLQGNSFNGMIPSALALLKGLQHLDLSQNNLSGLIPEGIQDISTLEFLNVSYNMLQGRVPTKGVFRIASKLALTGNSKLCGGISKLHLPPCPVEVKKQERHHTFRLIIVIISMVVFLLALSLIFLSIYWMRKRNKKPFSDSFIINQLDKISYQNLHHGTNGFSPGNLIGYGSFGSVYKGTLELEDKIVAVKVLNLQKKGAHKSFMAECNALKNIRHRNLVQILTCCSSIDYKGQEFKALVFEYMTKGSLETWLHPTIEIACQSLSLDLHQRLNIISDVASALHYLHYECGQTVVHCDLKPSNVLLDDCMVAHVSDFGLARLLSTIAISPKHTSTIGIKGTIGYAPPEYGMGSEASIQGDMYGFGVLVLEMLTGRRPTDKMFKDSYNLHSYVKIAIPNNLMQIMDPNVLSKKLEEAFNKRSIVEKCLLSLFKIGLTCTVESPKERMNMVDVIRELNLIKSSFPFGGVQGG